MAEPKCECRIVVSEGYPGYYRIEHCPLCKAAPEMLNLLKRYHRAALRDGDYPDTTAKAGTVIAKAEGKS